MDSKTEAIKKMNLTISEYNKWSNERNLEHRTIGDMEIYMLLCSTIDRFSQKDYAYQSNLRAIQQASIYTRQYGSGYPFVYVSDSCIEALAEILYTLCKEYENGYLEKMENLINRNIFNDYLEMTEYFLKEDHIDTAIIIIGCALEQHIKNLCKNNEIPIKDEEKDASYKASKLNDDLAKNRIYDNSYHDQISSWLKMRNDSAHGEWHKHPKEKVNLMLEGVRVFIRDYP